ncbi:MAG TPA: aldo/keto reductase [Candidatus Acidoferrales bacterium]|nr:aldo/keto reductase [Candidatus Acidoferrales bacterium]
MERRQLGRSSLSIAPLAFGGNVFGWTVDETTAFRLLDAFVARGFNLIDTADSYSRWAPGNKGGESEKIIGNWMRQRRNRDEVMIATKVGSDMGQGKRDISRKYILHAAEDSLRRLQTDYLDLYQTHWDVETVPVEETLEAYSQLVTEGKVRWIGASNLSPERLKSSLETSGKKDYPRYQTLQPEYNLYDREKFEMSYEKICLKENLSVISYYSLASGFLTGKYRSEADLQKSARGSGVKKYLTERGFRILSGLDEVAREYDSTPASIAIAWLQSRPSVAAPIASATNLAQLESLMKAAEIKLSDEAVLTLNEASKY